MADKIIIVGAGIVGLSTAYWLSKDGLNVTVVERGSIPNPLAASCDHHRLIRLFYGSSEGYCRRMPAAFEAWRVMWDDLPGAESRYYETTDVLTVSTREGDRADQSRSVMERAGLPFEKIDGAAEVSRRFPFLFPDFASYALLGAGGALMASRIMVDLADYLRANGVLLLEQSPVASVDHGGGRVTLQNGTELEADRVIVTAGVETVHLCPDLDLDLKPRRSLIVYADPPPHLVEAWRNGPSWGSLSGPEDLWGIAPVARLPLKVGCGALGSTDADDSNRTITRSEIDRLLAAYHGRFRDADQYRVRWAQANYWTLAPGEAFVLKAMDRTLVVSACSGHGFKFGALSGRDVAEAVTGKVPVELVARRMAGESLMESHPSSSSPGLFG